MPEISDHHRYLFLGKITDSLTSAEEKELTVLFAADPQAHADYLELVANLPSEDVAQGFTYLNSSGFWKDLPRELRHERTVRRTRRWGVAGGLVVVVASFLFAGGYLTNRPDRVISYAPRPHKTPSVELHLANGKTINLSSEKGTIDAGDLSLNNSGDALTYESTDGEPAGINSIIVPTGMDYKIHLTDGSVVWLNSTTKLQFPSRFARDKRTVTIDGEAYLQIAKDASRPFVVNVPNGEVQVTGTEFNVNTYKANEVRVALIAGGINVTDNKSTLHVEPGNQAVMTAGSLSQESFDARTVLSWQKGLFYFEKANLDDLTQVLGRWYGIETRFDKRSIRDKHFAGVLDKNKPVADFLDNLKVISKIDTYFDRDGVLHFR